MDSIDDLILRAANPFDSLRSVNFWHRQKDPEPVVQSIHQDAITAIEGTLEQISRDHYTRTIILDGDSGSGKTYLLGRLKQSFNHKAFFAYIPPFPQSDYIWRHILRYTVDSLVQVPAGQKYSQLLLWLKNVLLALKQRSLKDKIKENILDLLQTDRQLFIKRLKEIYKRSDSNSIYNADKFFGILHDLTDPKLYSLACEWLRADDLSEESLEALRLKSSIDTEQAAREILANFGRVAMNTQPIVLCFDQLESIARLPDGSLDLQSLFNINTKVHDEDKNFLIIISILTNTWEHYKTRIDQSHRARIDREVPLRLITLEQAEALWASRLNGLHRQAKATPQSAIYPLSLEELTESFPGGRTNPRDVLRLGRDMFQAYKEWLIQQTDALTTTATAIEPTALSDQNGNPPSAESTQPQPNTGSEPSPLLDIFKLRWQDELSKVQESVTRIRFFSSLELVEMLKEALIALQAQQVQAPLLERTKFAGYSFRYRPPQTNESLHSEAIGIVWTEDQGMDTFFHVMEACQRFLEAKLGQHSEQELEYPAESRPAESRMEMELCQLYLLRAESIGKPSLKGHQLYRQIFSQPPHRHIEPDLTSVQLLAAYYNLVKDSREGDLVMGSQAIGLKTLQGLVQTAQVLADCPLIRLLGFYPPDVESTEAGPITPGLAVFPPPESPYQPNPAPTNPKLLRQIEDYLFSLVRTHPVIGLQTLIQSTLRQFPQVEADWVNDRIHVLCEMQQIQILNPTEPIEAQLICQKRT
ncbi:MAG: hypothetical protein MUF72_06755 [Elainella sp. Prado103]|nr:hypothetical protein [Elainella sp. Prado103]